MLIDSALLLRRILTLGMECIYCSQIKGKYFTLSPPFTKAV